jgi:hypothetical protein
MINAQVSRQSLNTALRTDPEYARFINTVNGLIVKAIEKHKNYVRIEKHVNETYNEELSKLAKSLGYILNTDIEFNYKYDAIYEMDMPFDKEYYVIYF